MAFDPNAPATNNNAYNDIAQIREDLNQLRGMEFGTSFPANPRNCQWFCKTDDGTAGKVYQRNKDNTAWIFQFDLAYPVQDHVNKNITPSIAVHGIQQGTGNGLDADKVDGYDAVDLNKNLENIVNNGSFETWLNDTSSPPNGWVVTDGTVSRSTDKTRGAYAAVLTRSGAFPAFLYHDVTDYERLKNVTVILSAKVKCSVASRARIQINDGVTTTSSSYHSGGGTWETLSVFATVDVAATQLRVQLKIENNTGNATFDEVVLREGNLLSSFAPAFVDSLPVQANFWADGSIVVSGGPFHPCRQYITTIQYCIIPVRGRHILSDLFIEKWTLMIYISWGWWRPGPAASNGN